MSGLSFAIWLALVACVIGGVRGGLILADSDTPLFSPWTLEAAPARTLGISLLVAHAATAAVLGYSATLGQGMALARGLGWITAAVVGFWGARKLGQRPRGAILDLLTGVVLALPVWIAMARLAHGVTI